MSGAEYIEAGDTNSTDFEKVTLGNIKYFWFAVNDNTGSGDDGSTAVYDVRKAGAASSDEPTHSGNADLLTHFGYQNGCYEVSIPVSADNGFAVDRTYAVFATILVSGKNPSGFIGSFKT